MLITVFTPSYNRAYTLGRLYESLIRQNSKNFCWLIIDDGSTDKTEEIVEKWIKEKNIEIRYYKQENQGKSMAHNKGVELTTTDLFVCVDSDDYLTDDAVEEIEYCWNHARESDVGILAFKKSEEMMVTRIQHGGENARTTLKNAYDNLGLVGDTMLVYRTSIIKKYSFPHFEGEKFVPEAYLYDLIDQDGPLILLEKPLYICEYLSDGYTSDMGKLLKNNPQGYLAYINQRLKIDKTVRERFLDSIRYIAMAIAEGNKSIISQAVYPVYALVAYPFGVLFYYKRYKNV